MNRTGPPNMHLGFTREYVPKKGKLCSGTGINAAPQIQDNVT
jgi:hypothetical protein